MELIVESLRQLRHVIALAEQRHFGRAAGAVGITQAALTQSVQKLEDSYGVRLFERRPGDVTLTAFGEVVLEAAMEATSKVQHMRRQIGLMQKMASGRLIVGCDPYFATPIVAPALVRLMNDFPQLAFSVQLGGWDTMEAKLLSKEVDLYLGFEFPALDPRISTESHALPSFAVFGRSGHPLSARDNLRMSDLLGFPNAVPPASPWLISKFKDFYESAGVDEKTVPHYLVTSDFSMIKKLVKHSDALAVALPRAIDDELKSGMFEVIPIPELEFAVSVVVARLDRRGLPPAAQELLKEIRSEIFSLD